MIPAKLIAPGQLIDPRALETLITDSHQKLNCLKTGVSNSSAVTLSINQRQTTSLLRQLKFWCECGIR